jgi:hypothetical protein
MSDNLTAKILAELKRDWSEYRNFYSNASKNERERWVVREFLSHLLVTFNDQEIVSEPQHSEVDVIFRTARFQVKEIPDPNFKRGDEIRATYEQVKKAKTLQDTVGPGFVYDMPELADGYDLVKERAAALASQAKYSATKENLDLLLYVTRTRTSRVRLSRVWAADFSTLGWRSVSCLMGSDSIVLHAMSYAPQFLRTTVDVS